jgi:lipoprotein-releasing system ATP-binding protein
MKVLELIDLNKKFAYGSEVLPILNGLNFTISKGEIISIVGQSGSGKTTFLQIAGLLDAPTSGKISFCGKDCTNLSEVEQVVLRRHEIGFVYQFHHLLPEFSALENLVIPQLIAGVGVQEAKNNALDMLHLLGLQDRATHLPCALSGGEKQRIAIARSVINKPTLLLADEPTGNLDPETAAYVFNFLMTLVRKLEMAMVIVTHNIEVAKQADRCLTLRDGVLV